MTSCRKDFYRFNPYREGETGIKKTETRASEWTLLNQLSRVHSLVYDPVTGPPSSGKHTKVQGNRKVLHRTVHWHPDINWGPLVKISSSTRPGSGPHPTEDVGKDHSVNLQHEVNINLSHKHLIYPSDINISQPTVSDFVLSNRLSSVESSGSTCEYIHRVFMIHRDVKDILINYRNITVHQTEGVVSRQLTTQILSTRPSSDLWITVYYRYMVSCKRKNVGRNPNYSKERNNPHRLPYS